MLEWEDREKNLKKPFFFFLPINGTSQRVPDPTVNVGTIGNSNGEGTEKTLDCQPESQDYDKSKLSSRFPFVALKALNHGNSQLRT